MTNRHSLIPNPESRRGTTTGTSMNAEATDRRRALQMRTIKVGVIVGVYNAEATIEETITSAMRQDIPDHLIKVLLCRDDSAQVNLPNGDVPISGVHHDVHLHGGCEIDFHAWVCCYNDSSTDRSLEILQSLETDRTSVKKCKSGDTCATVTVHTKLVIGTAPSGTTSRGAGYARNQAVKLLGGDETDFLCILDSDDIMHPTRIAEQTCAMMALESEEERYKTLMGCQFDRIPKDSTQHYTKWANSLSDERLYLEKFRECTLVRNFDVVVFLVRVCCSSH